MISTLRKWHLGLCQSIKNRNIKWIVNIDETPVCYDLTFNKTLHKKGALEVLIDTVDTSKKRVTLILGIFIHVDTKQVGKCRPLLIVKGKTERVTRDITAKTDGEIEVAFNNDTVTFYGFVCSAKRKRFKEICALLNG